MIFVFGSNLLGIHGSGAAKYARMNEGAVYGKGIGRTGNSYAIPTKLSPYKSMEVNKLPAYVDFFLEYARKHPELTFKVTRIGCGLAGFTDEQIGPMFAHASSNCYFDPIWAKKFGYQSWQ